jgi:hypothetical protein
MFSGFREVMVMPSAPLRANSSAVACPMPRLAPVTKTTFPSTVISTLLLHPGRVGQ